MLRHGNQLCGENYYTVESTGFVSAQINKGDKYTKDRYEFGDCFKDYNVARQISEGIKTRTTLQRWAETHCKEKIDWDNYDQIKYRLTYNSKFDKIVIKQTDYIKEPFQVYFSSLYYAKLAIEEIGEERIKNWLKPIQSNIEEGE